MDNVYQHTQGTVPRNPATKPLTAWEKSLSGILRTQRPVILAQIRAWRKNNPSGTPEQCLRAFELRYLNLITGTGASAGASSAIPGFGTLASFAVTGAETIALLNATALFGLVHCEIRGIVDVDSDHMRTFVQSLIIGSSAKEIIDALSPKSALKNAHKPVSWGKNLMRLAPQKLSVNSQIGDRIRKEFLKRAAKKLGSSALGKFIPFGVGAIWGGAGNRIFGKGIIKTAREAMGPAPLEFPAHLSIAAPNTPVPQKLFGFIPLKTKP